MTAWFSAYSTPFTGIRQLYKLGDDGSVTKWTADPGNGAFPTEGLDPSDLTFFNNAVWFGGETSNSGYQLFNLGNDGSVTKWTSIDGNLNPHDLTVFNN